MKQTFSCGCWLDTDHEAEFQLIETAWIENPPGPPIYVKRSTSGIHFCEDHALVKGEA